MRSFYSVPSLCHVWNVHWDFSTTFTWKKKAVRPPRRRSFYQKAWQWPIRHYECYSESVKKEQKLHLDIFFRFAVAKIPSFPNPLSHKRSPLPPKTYYYTFWYISQCVIQTLLWPIYLLLFCQNHLYVFLAVLGLGHFWSLGISRIWLH